MKTLLHNKTLTAQVEIDMETLRQSRDTRFANMRGRLDASLKVIDAVLEGLDLDSLARFKEFERQNDPCRGEE